MKSSLRVLFALSLSAAALATGCADFEPDVEDTFESEDDLVTASEPTLQNVQARVFDVACANSGCHSAEDAAGGIDLSNASASYAALVDVPATNSIAKENRWLRVKPGDPDRSFLCRKMDLPGMGEGAPMPPGEWRVDDEHVALIEDWIDAGALP